jgi:hypothetical protein
VIIARSKDLFDLWQSGREPVKAPLEAALQKMFDERLTGKEPAETEAILRNGMPLLARSAGLTDPVPGKPLDFTFDGGRVTIAICNEIDHRGLASRLKKISEAWKPAGNQSLLLLRDARMAPIPATAKACHQHIASLQQRGGRLTTVSQEAVATLAALRRLLSDAESGDLAHEGEPVPSGAVERWIAGHVPEALEPLLARLKETSRRDGLTPALAALLAERKMVTLEDAARSLEVAPGEVEECARRDPRQFGILGGGVRVLFQPVAATTAG